MSSILSYLALARQASAVSSRASSILSTSSEMSSLSWENSVMRRSSPSTSFMAYHLRLFSGTLPLMTSSAADMVCSISASYLMTLRTSVSLATSSRAPSISSIPVPLSADTGMTGHPSSLESFSTSTESPSFSSASIMFRPMTMGTFSSSNWSVRYRFLSMLVASTMFRIASGLSFMM